MCASGRMNIEPAASADAIPSILARAEKQIEDSVSAGARPGCTHARPDATSDGATNMARDGGGVYDSERYWNAVTPAYDGGSLHVFRSGGLTIPLIERPLPQSLLGSLHRLRRTHDVVSPYDFAGPLVSGGSIASDWTAFQEYAHARGWLTAFFRFHPFQTEVNTWRDLRGLDLAYQGDHMVADLQGLSRGELLSQFKRQVRRDLRVADRGGVVCSLAPFSRPMISRFAAVYDKTMARRESAPFYRFSETFFAGLHESLGSTGENLWLAAAFHADELISASLILIEDDTAFYYLAGFDFAYRRLCSMNAMLFEACHSLSRMGVRRLFLGGGAPGVAAFKARFATSTVPFFTGRAVFCEESLAAIRSGLPSTEFFPPYRDPSLIVTRPCS